MEAEEILPLEIPDTMLHILLPGVLFFCHFPPGHMLNDLIIAQAPYPVSVPVCAV